MRIVFTPQGWEDYVHWQSADRAILRRVNRLLDDALTQHLQDTGLQVWRASHYPCGDGGLSLGQAWVAHQRLTAPVSLTA